MGTDAVALLAVVKPPQGFVSDGVHLHSDHPMLRKAFIWVLHNLVLSSFTETRHNIVLV